MATQIQPITDLSAQFSLLTTNINSSFNSVDKLQLSMKTGLGGAVGQLAINKLAGISEGMNKITGIGINFSNLNDAFSGMNKQFDALRQGIELAGNQLNNLDSSSTGLK